jgi:hypothetical protein
MEAGMLGPLPRIRVAGTNFFFFNRIIVWLSALSIEFISGINRPQREADHYSLLNAEVNGTLQFTSVPSTRLVFLLYEFYCSLDVVYCYFLPSHRIRMCSCHFMNTP